MSKFIRRKAAAPGEAAAPLRPTGFTEAELAAADWVRELEEVRANYMRPTNAEVRKSGSAATPSTCQAREVLKFNRTETAGREKKEDHKGPLVKDKKEKKDKQAKSNKNDGKKKKSKDKKERREIRGMLDDLLGAADEADPAEKPKKGKKRHKDKEASRDRKQRRRLEKEMRRLERRAEKEARNALRADGAPPGPAALAKPSAPPPADTAAGTGGDAIDRLITAARLEVMGSTQQETAGGSRSSSASPGRPAAEGAQRELPVPHDPLNPLEEAYNLKAYQELLKGRRRRRRTPEPTDREWDHGPFLLRSPSPCRLRTDGAMYPTRRGAWRSKAGGVYLPPAEETLKSPSRSPARYLYPEDFQRRAVPTRRSPSYAPEPRARSSSSSSTTASRRSRSSSSSSSSSSSRRRRRDKKRARRSRSPPARSKTPPPRQRSPSYQPERAPEAA